MFAAKLWNSTSFFHRRDAFMTFDKFNNLINWHPDQQDSFIDVGCATGNLIQNILLPTIPKTFSRILGVDISEHMLGYARNSINHPKIAFKQLDITTPHLDPVDLEQYDHLTGFCLLHWIIDSKQQIAINNMYKLLKPNGGDCILTSFVSTQHQITHLELKHHKKWGKYYENAEDLVSPYYFVANPKEKLENHLKVAGFKSYEVQFSSGRYPFFMSKLKDLTIATCAFFNDIPAEELDEYATDFTTIMLKNAKPKPKGFEHFDFISEYTRLEAYAHMFAPKLWQASSFFPKRDSFAAFDKFNHLINWRSDQLDSFIDVGCATGDLIQNIILPSIPRTFSRIVGIDISDRMLEYARNSVNHPKISFKQLDITTTQLDEANLGQFDHLTGFFLLHWIAGSKQQIAINNMYKLLKPNGGDCILTSFVSTQHQIPHLELKHHKKWGKYYEDPKDIVSPYYFVDNPKEKLENHLQVAGFKSFHVHFSSGRYPFFMSKLKDLTIATCAILKTIPDEELDEYATDFTTIMLKNAKPKPKGFEHFDFISEYTRLEAYARK